MNTSQSPPGGSRVDAGTTVTITVAVPEEDGGASPDEGGDEQNPGPENPNDGAPSPGGGDG